MSTSINTQIIPITSALSPVSSVPAKTSSREEISNAVDDQNDREVDLSISAQEDSTKVTQDPEILDKENISKVVQDLNDYVQNTRRQLRFNVDEETGYTVVQVIDSETKETIRQIPAEEIMALARQIAEADIGKGGLFKGLV